MSNITIDGIVMPTTKKITYTKVEISSTVTTADGTDYKDIKGYKAVVVATWDWVPSGTVVSLLSSAVLEGGFHSVFYPSFDGTWKTTEMSVSIPTISVFNYSSEGSPVWHNVSITFTSRGTVNV